MRALAKVFHVHPTSIPDGSKPADWLRRCFVDEPENSGATSQPAWIHQEYLEGERENPWLSGQTCVRWPTAPARNRFAREDPRRVAPTPRMSPDAAVDKSSGGKSPHRGLMLREFQRWRDRRTQAAPPQSPHRQA